MDALLRAAHPRRPTLDMAISHALLREAASTGRSATRLYRPGATLAFGRLDKLRPGFAQAVAAARRHGFEPVLRSSGGHAVAYDGRSLIFEAITAEPDTTAGLEARFRDGAATIAHALGALGLQPHVGALPREYCAGSYSVSLDGQLKVAGTAQRLISGAALFSAVIVVAGGADIRAALTDVYAELGIEWDVRTAGAIADVAPAIAIDDVERALIAAARERRALLDEEIAPATLERALALEGDHRIA